MRWTRRTSFESFDGILLLLTRLDRRSSISLQIISIPRFRRSRIGTMFSSSSRMREVGKRIVGFESRRHDGEGKIIRGRWRDFVA